MSAANDYYQKRVKACIWSKDNLCPPPSSLQDAWDEVSTELLGKDWYTTLSVGSSQVRTEQVCAILDKYVDKPKRKQLSLVYSVILAFLLGLIVGVILP